MQRISIPIAGMIGLFGFGITMLVSSVVEGLPAVYTERFLSRMFASAVTPVAAATISDYARTEQGRVRRLTVVSMAGIAGFLLGPMLGLIVTRIAAASTARSVPAGSVAIPLAAAAVLAFLAGVAVGLTVPGRNGGGPVAAGTGVVPRDAAVVANLLMLSFIVSAGVGVFEVGLVLRGKQELQLTPSQIAVMFSACSLVMFGLQAIVLSPRVKPGFTRWLIGPALAVLAGGLLLVLRVSSFLLMLGVIAAVSASAGILSPVLTYWISAKAGKAQGWELGKQTAAASLGVTIGLGGRRSAVQSGGLARRRLCPHRGAYADRSSRRTAGAGRN